MYNATGWLTNNCNTHIDQYFKKWRQSGNEIWSVNRIQHEEHFSWKSIHKIWWRNYSPNLFKDRNWAHLWINSLKLFKFFLFYANSRTIELYWMKLLPQHKAVLKNKKWSGTSLPALFSAWFLKKNVSLHVFCYLSKFNYLVAFTSWGIGQYLYCNCLFPRLWLHQFCN